MARAPSYRYRVDGLGAVRTADAETWSSCGRVVVQRPMWLGPSSRCERDILRVFAALLDVDRLSPRNLRDGARDLRQVLWQRELTVEIAVEDPERWNSIAPTLVRLLNFMTDDTWSVTFIVGGAPPAQEVLGALALQEADEIALFSGGLDSVLGMYARNRERRRRFVAVSAWGNDVRGRAQSIALTALQREGVSVQWLKFVHQLRDSHRSRSGIESSQRTRGLLFLAMGAATAAHLGKPEFVVEPQRRQKENDHDLFAAVG